jgi:Domain of unknown function (DUF5671)
MIFGLLFVIAILALVIGGIRRVSTRSMNDGNRTQTLRRSFEYGLLFAMLVVSAAGLSGLLTRLFGIGQDVASDPVAFARDVSFTVVGVPVLAALTQWTRRQFDRDLTEAHSFAFGLFLAVASTTTLTMSLVALYDVLTWSTGITSDWRAPTARLIVWGVAWLEISMTRSIYAHPDQDQAVNLSGSLVGLGITVAGFVAVIGSLTQLAFGLSADVLISPGTEPVLRGVITVAIGLPVWYFHWVRGARDSQRTTIWLSYVLLAGVGGSLVAAIASASTVIYQALVWFLGTPISTDAHVHFSSTPVNAAYVVVGLVTLVYHQSVLRDGRKETRTEVTRVFEYLMSGISLVAVATGIGILVIALIESVTGTNVMNNGNATNTLLLSLTLLLVGTPSWWMFWNQIQNMVDVNPEIEVSAPTRRSYLYLLFGVGGIAAIVSLIVGIFLLFSDIFQSQFSSDTFRGMRFAIGVLLTTGTVSAYHFMVYRGERYFIREPRLPHSIILVGPKDPELVREIVEKTGSRVQVWVAADAEHKVWSHSEVMALLAHESGQDLLILMNGNGLEAVPMVHV